MTTVHVTGSGQGKTQQRAVVSLASSGIVVAAVTSKRIKVYHFSCQSRNDGMTVQFTDGDGGSNLTHLWTFNSREGVIGPVSIPDVFLFATSAGNPLYAVISGTGTVDIDVGHWDDDAV